MELVGIAVSEESRQTVRHAGAVAVQRMLVVAVGFLFAAVVPRTMGPQVYGQFSLIESMSLWFGMFSGLGAVSMMTRFVPEFVAKGDRVGLRRMASGLLALRMLSGVVGSAAYLGLAAIWLRDISPLAIGLVAVAVAIRLASNLPFTLFLGLNQAARWEMAVVLRRSLTLPLVYAGFRMGGLVGATAGVLLAEMGVLLTGLWWSREYLEWAFLRIDRKFLEPFLRFSTAFFAGNVLILLFQQGGPAAVKFLSGDYAETAYYTIAFQAYLGITSAAWRLLSAFGPLLSSLHTRGNFDQVKTWVERLLKLFSVTTVLGCALTVTLAGPIVRLVLGPGFEPVIQLLPLLALATHWYGLGGLARLLAVTYGEPRASISSAALQLVTFLVASSLLVPAMGSLGACLGIVIASGLFAIFGTWQMRRHVPYSMKTWALVTLLGIGLAPIVLVWSAAPAMRLAVFSAVFLGSLRLLRVVGADEVRALRKYLARGPATNGAPDRKPGQERGF